MDRVEGSLYSEGLYRRAELVFHRYLTPLEPHPTDRDPILPESLPIKALLFDVYGTLFISGSGDIGVVQTQNPEHAMRRAMREAGFPLMEEDASYTSIFFSLIEKHHEARRREGILFPEVDILEIWKEFIEALIEEGRFEGESPSEEDLPLLAIRYELISNPVFPMPGAEELLSFLREAGFTLGIISNAQFYTPLLFRHFWNHFPPSLGFRSDLCIYSFLCGEAKPSRSLFEKARSLLETEGVDPDQVLYVGNDMRNDIAPAAEVGFRTALFAGDSRSLRTREEDPSCRGVVPDCVITDLRELLSPITATKEVPR
ncbi:Haloacid dehalogenase domain protein hydrolase [Spirochaeta thermophila DSM 6578]|uniref:Haloacid dehalogenase domain protein hydrolase n=1 Tax=Winmispira thermophila (strain ATCC 700085 / DSM 6578 / Z-1203) TaxID=869211 RepID=G0GDM6_WINT7|nr:HAD family hydrolase [Spirochaeta thermophila]AEJ61373.1 Haloacid dehalogenase domain protein hydrolase [Spirochaeta thermophila DSM 6578]